MHDIKLSVIINSYRRKNYIKEAVLSILNQKFVKNKYEIIVVKGFLDDEIDGFLRDYAIANIYVAGENNGERWVRGIKESQGDLICFLDDDDTFSKIKLQRVYNVYKETGFDYYHNCYTFDEYKLSREPNNYILIKHDHSIRSFRKLLKYNIKYKMNINSSSICIRKSFIIKSLKESVKVTVGWDVFIFYLFLAEANIFIEDKTYLTYYRQHTSYTHSTSVVSEFVKREVIRNDDADRAYRVYIDAVPQTFLKKILKYEALSYRITGYICGSYIYTEPTILELILFLAFSKSYSVIFRITYFLLGSLSKLSREVAFRVYFGLIRKL